ARFRATTQETRLVLSDTSIRSKRHESVMSIVMYRNSFLPGMVSHRFRVERVVQDDLASQFGISRIPVRDASRCLETEGLASSFINKTWVISRRCARYQRTEE